MLSKCSKDAKKPSFLGIRPGNGLVSPIVQPTDFAACDLLFNVALRRHCRHLAIISKPEEPSTIAALTKADVIH